MNKVFSFVKDAALSAISGMGNILGSAKDKLKLNINTSDCWLNFLNTNLKWAVGFFIRVMTVYLTIGLCLFLIKWSGITKEIRAVYQRDILGIEQKSTAVISSPTINYANDIKDIDSTIEMLKGKKNVKK